MRKTYLAKSGHTIFVERIPYSQLPENIQSNEHSKSYTTFYVARNFDKHGVVFMYLGKGHKKAPKEIVAWYPATGSFWSGFGLTILDAINGAQKDGWKYA